MVAPMDKETAPLRRLRSGQTFYNLERPVAPCGKFQRSHQLRIWEAARELFPPAAKENACDHTEKTLHFGNSTDFLGTSLAVQC